MKVEELTDEATRDDIRNAVKNSIYERIQKGMGVKQASDEVHQIAKKILGDKYGHE